MRVVTFTVREVQLALAIVAKQKNELVSNENNADEIIALAYKANGVVTFCPDGSIDVEPIRVVSG